jgi:hypothetical protein
MKNVFAEYPLRYSMKLVELGARSMDFVDLEFSELGCLAGKKMEWSYFCESGAAWSSPKHALSLAPFSVFLVRLPPVRLPPVTL